MRPTMVIGAETGATSTLTSTDTRDTSPAISATIGMVARSAAMATASARDKISGHFSGARTRCIMGVSTTIDAVAAHESAKPKLARSEEHTSELQSRGHLVCRLLLEKKKKRNY